MAEPEFSATGVRIERWPRSLTKAGQVLVKDGRLVLLTSNGREIDSAPLGSVQASKAWFAGDDSTVATVNGTRYRLTMGHRGRKPDGAELAHRFLEAIRSARTPPEHPGGA
ncbi:hypothetical protein [Streptomyces sp. H27-C3]|uniref:hypothetical protein n=1 Tax=Streptomyces sp. H27-C3 TaxID=3046305 RepID=UPI0024B87952|nr:hypothetical protein [Streptomyces sp. H27-C3]MDJ0460284.1 hypothetical protein [Streptomyces sp. H27-C3]